MSNDIIIAKQGFTEEQKRLIKDSICKGATDAEVSLFIGIAEKVQLDPFARQIYSVGRWDAKLGREVRTVQTSIDGFRVVAQRSGDYAGQLGPFWCGADGVWVDVWLKKEYPLAAKVGVLRKDFKEPLWAVANWDAYCQVGKNGITNMWQKMGPLMIAKCFDEQTEVLTTNGFEKFSKVKGDVIQYSEKHGLESTDSKVFYQKYSGDMIEVNSDMVNFCVTPNHDMVTTFGKVEAGAMYETSHSRGPWRIPMRISNHKRERLFNDDDLMLMGAYMADGYSKQTKEHIKIAVSRKRKVDVLNALLPQMKKIIRSSGSIAKCETRDIKTNFDKTMFYFSSGRISRLIKDNKEIDLQDLLKLEKHEARVFLDTWILFDGYENKKTKVRRVYTSNKNHCRAIEVLSAIAGYSISTRKNRQSDIGGINYCYTISKPEPIAVFKNDKDSSIKIVKNKTKKVWCVTVPSGMIIVRRNGFSMICGNCAEALALRKAFPQDLSGLYTSEEMSQTDADNSESKPVIETKTVAKMVDNSKIKLDEMNQLGKIFSLLTKDLSKEDKIKVAKESLGVNAWAEVAKLPLDKIKALKVELEKELASKEKIEPNPITDIINGVNWDDVK